MAKYTLFSLKPWMEGDRGPYYCPDCGVVEGFFHYNPQVRQLIEVREVNFERPRPEVVELLGCENQSCPVLVLDEDAEIPESAKKSVSSGRAFIDDGREICDYLARVFHCVQPH